MSRETSGACLCRPTTGTRPRSWKPGVRDVLLRATGGTAGLLGGSIAAAAVPLVHKGREQTAATTKVLCCLGLTGSHPQPRFSLALRHAHWFSVSCSSECNIVVPSRLPDAPPRDHSLCDHQLKPKCTDSTRHLTNDQNRLIHIQTPSSSGAASFKSLYLKRPYTAHRNGRSSLGGASDTALRLPTRNNSPLTGDPLETRDPVPQL